MKTLITLSVLQTIGIIVLVVHASREEHPAALAPATSQDTSTRAVVAASANVEEDPGQVGWHRKKAPPHAGPFLSSGGA